MKNNIIIGAILGDIAGSRIEHRRPANFDWAIAPLFTEKCKFTDDTVLTLAVKYAIENEITFENAFRLLGNKYSSRGYGGNFRRWLKTPSMGAYGSYGNGSAMRASYIGQKFDTIDEILNWARESAIVSHDHIEGIKGAEATAVAIFLAKNGKSKKEVLDYMKEVFGYHTTKTLAELRPTTKFDVTCQGSLPLALRCFYESSDYESCIRNVFSMKCDTDTIACIAGGMAAAYYGTTGLDNEAILNKYLDEYLLGILYS